MRTQHLKLLVILLLSAMAALQASPLQAQSAIVSTTVQFKEIAGVDSNLLSLDVYSQLGAFNRPVMIYVHGGGWAIGDKANVQVKDDFFLSEGYVFISTNYRLSPDADFPAHAEDVASAIRWTFDNVVNFGGDPERIFLMGHSAGAHLVALVATDERYLEAEGLALENISAVIPNDTQGYDIPRLAEQRGGTLSEVYTRAFGEDPEFWAFASPITYVESGKAIPPMFIAYSRGSNPDNVNPSRRLHAEAFRDALLNAGVYAESMGNTDQTHADINQQFGTLDDPITQGVMDFIAGLD